MSMETGNGNIDAESDWEYEYESDEYEDFYITIDLPEQKEQSQSSTVPDIFQLYVPPGGKTPKSKRGRSVTGKKPYKRRKRNPVTGELEEIEQPAEHNAPEEDQQLQNDVEPSTLQPPTKDVQAQIDNLDPEEYIVTNSKDLKDDKTIQILDLHSDNPLISFRGNIYSCQWSTTLGTDMFFAKRPEAISEDNSKSMCSFDKWNLLGLSATRLIATEAKLTHRALAGLQSHLADVEGQKEEPRQAGFLRRLVDLQIKKGEISAAIDVDPAVSTVSDSTADLTKHRALQVLFAGPTSINRDTRGIRGP